MKIGLALLALAAAACHPTPSPAPLPDASDAGLLGDSGTSDVCAHLAALGCDEGRAPNCTAVFQHAQSSRLTDLKPACLLGAGTKAAVRACGSVACP